MNAKPGDRLRQIADLIDIASKYIGGPAGALTANRLGRLAQDVREQADSVDETIAVLSDPDAMAAIEDAEMERGQRDV